MLEPYIEELNKLRIILASSSPRRQQILKSLGLKFEVFPSGFDEGCIHPAKFMTRGDYVAEMAYRKALQVFYEFQEANKKADMFIGADTVVAYKEIILGKPKDAEEAKEFLRKLSGDTHKVYSGVSVVSSGFSHRFFQETEVKFAKLKEPMIEAYVKTGEPLDKAGAYAIQGMGGTFVKGIKGDPFNVVGFPLNQFCEHFLNDVLTSKNFSHILKKEAKVPQF